MKINKQLFLDASGALGIQTPVLVEKDYYVVQILKKLSELDFGEYDLIFTGGTCLSKTNRSLYRFSEDIDFKLSPTPQAKEKSRSYRKKIKKEINQLINESIDKIDYFKVESELKRNEYGLQVFNISYPTVFDCPDYMRPYIKLELFESSQFDGPIHNEICSFVNKALNNSPEVNNIPCSSINSIAAEKFVSLLRRTAAELRGLDSNPDKTLVRHAYDLNIILQDIIDDTSILELIPKVIENDIEQFGNKHDEFKLNPMQEIEIALDNIINNKEFEDRYQLFLSPLVYNNTPKNWDEVKTTLTDIYRKII